MECIGMLGRGAINCMGSQFPCNTGNESCMYVTVIQQSTAETSETVVDFSKRDTYRLHTDKDIFCLKTRWPVRLSEPL